MVEVDWFRKGEGREMQNLNCDSHISPFHVHDLHPKIPIPPLYPSPTPRRVVPISRYSSRAPTQPQNGTRDIIRRFRLPRELLWRNIPRRHPHPFHLDHLQARKEGYAHPPTSELTNRYTPVTMFMLRVSDFACGTTGQKTVRSDETILASNRTPLTGLACPGVFALRHSECTACAWSIDI